MVASDVRIGADVVIFRPELVNLFGCEIGNSSRIGPFVEIQRGAVIGNKCKVSSHSFICSGVVIGNGVFIGHGVMFINDAYPAAVNEDGSLQTDADWDVVGTEVGDRASIGTHATILGGIRIGEGALVGAGAVVTKDVPSHAIVAGNPARIIGDVRTRRTSDLGKRRISNAACCFRPEAACKHASEKGTTV